MSYQFNTITDIIWSLQDNHTHACSSVQWNTRAGWTIPDILARLSHHPDNQLLQTDNRVCIKSSHSLALFGGKKKKKNQQSLFLLHWFVTTFLWKAILPNSSEYSCTCPHAFRAHAHMPSEHMHAACMSWVYCRLWCSTSPTLHMAMNVSVNEKATAQ